MAKSILIIDDSLMLLRFAGNILGKRGDQWEVLTARRAGEALRLVQNQVPDLVLVDQALPDSSGEELCAQFRGSERLTNVPMVMMCVNGSAEGEFQKQNENVVAVLEKPFTPDSLVEVVEHALQGRSPFPTPPPVREKPGVPGKKTSSGGQKFGRVTPVKKSSGFKPRRLPLRLGVPRVRADIGGDVELGSVNIAFSGRLGKFSLADALETIQEDGLTGVLRVFTDRFPVELYTEEGAVALVTTRDTKEYLEGAAISLPRHHAELAGQARQYQSETGCPLFLPLVRRNVFALEEALDLTEEYGGRLFAGLWTRRKLRFEFEELKELPGYVREFPKRMENAVEWMLLNLRQVPAEAVGALDEFDFTGVPAYTRKGYERIRYLPLEEEEVQFATIVSGSLSLENIAESLKLEPGEVLRIFFRFYIMGLMEYWPASVVEEAG